MSKTLRPFQYYLKFELFKAFVVGFLFFALPASFVGVIAFQTTFMFVPQADLIALIGWVLLEAILFFAVKISNDTLKNYRNYEEFDYKLLFILWFVIVSSIITIACGFLALIF